MSVVLLTLTLAVALVDAGLFTDDVEWLGRRRAA